MLHSCAPLRVGVMTVVVVEGNVKGCVCARQPRLYRQKSSESARFSYCAFAASILAESGVRKSTEVGLKMLVWKRFSSCSFDS